MNKKWLSLIAIAALGVLVVLVTAYSNGKVVVSEPSISFVSHTEYWSGDHASTIVRLVDYKGDAFTVNDCYANIFYPNKTAFVTHGEMNQSAIPGNWFRTDTAPLAEGTYEQEVICTYSGTKTTKASQSFHVNPALNFLRNISAETISTNVSINAVNVTITGLIENRTGNLSNQLTLAHTDLTDLMGKIHDSISRNISLSNADLNTNLTGVQISLQGKVTSTGQDILSNISVSEGNLTTILKEINHTLNSQLAANNVTIAADLSNLQVSITGNITDAKQQIIAQVAVLHN